MQKVEVAGREVYKLAAGGAMRTIPQNTSPDVKVAPHFWQR